MDALKQLPREVQVVLGGAVLYVIFSFFDWQQVSAFGYSVGRTEWTGFGIIASLVAIVLLAWELARMFNIEIPLGSLTPGLASAGLALLLLVFTVITFLTHSDARHWPAWIGLLLSIAIGVAAFRRAQAEGVQMPELPKSVGASGAGSGAAGGGGSTPPPPAPPPSEEAPPPPAPADSSTQD